MVDINDHRIAGISEKPVHRFFVNAGIYLLQPEVLDFIPKQSLLDMPDLVESLILSHYQAIAFPIHEYWLDVGQIEDFKEANGEFSNLFE